jgi:quinol monooxygenase YgiN
MSMRLTVQLQIQPGKSEEFETIAHAAATRVRAEDNGCEMYDLFRSIDDPNRYVLIESWATQADLDDHGKSPAMADMGKIGPLLAGRPVMHRYEG